MNTLGEFPLTRLENGKHVIARNPSQNQVVSGTITNVNDKYIVVEIGYHVTVTLDRKVWDFFTRNK